jgi:hypothetical protein
MAISAVRLPTELMEAKEIAMKITSSALHLESSHVKKQEHEVNESLRMWVGNHRPNFEGVGQVPVTPQSPAPQVQLSNAGISAQSSETEAIQTSLDAVENDPMLRLIKAMVAMLTGHDVNVFDSTTLKNSPTPVTTQASNAQPVEQALAPQNAGYGVEYDRHESYTESEQTSFQASGVVKTANGQEISFSVSISMARSYHEESNASIRTGDARKKQDPLILNFTGASAQLTSQRFKFDLNSDGKMEEINFMAQGSGFLVLDKNGDGKINNGSELFGTRSGDGFAELAKLDIDHNGWIDENDSTYNQLQVWSKDAAGNDQLASLRQANVGALSLAKIETPFDIKNSSNVLQGQIRSTGIFLHENGKTGTMQQIDLTA